MSQAEEQRNAEIIERYAKWFCNWAPSAAAIIHGPTRLSTVLLPAAWLPNVQERILKSIEPEGQENDGRWLTAEIATAGLAFFQLASDILPGEPFIHSSTRGDLVAEFADGTVPITAIISHDWVLLFAAVDGVPLQTKLALGGPESESRFELCRFTQSLTTHATVGTRS